MQTETNDSIQYDNKGHDESALATLTPPADIGFVTGSSPKSSEGIRSVNELNAFFTDNYRELYRRMHVMASFHRPHRGGSATPLLRMLSTLRRSPDGLHEPWAVVTT